MLLSNLFYSLAGLCLKVALREANPENGYFWEVIGTLVAAGAILLFWSGGRARMRDMLTGVRTLAYAGCAFNEVIANVGGLVLTTALTAGTLAGVTTLYATQPLFVVPFISLTNWLHHDSVASENHSHALLPRWSIIVTVIIGIYFLST
jgi:uncharacterized membrane protein